MRANSSPYIPLLQLHFRESTEKAAACSQTNDALHLSGTKIIDTQVFQQQLRTLLVLLRSIFSHKTTFRCVFFLFADPVIYYTAQRHFAGHNNINIGFISPDGFRSTQGVNQRVLSEICRRASVIFLLGEFVDVRMIGRAVSLLRQGTPAPIIISKSRFSSRSYNAIYSIEDLPSRPALVPLWLAFFVNIVDVARM